MKKVEKSLSKEYPILRLYKSDMEKISNILKEHCKKIDIVADGFKLDEFSELNKIKKQEIVDFEITGYDPYLSVDFSEYSAKIYISNGEDARLRGLLEQIGEILSERRSPLRFILQPWMSAVFFNLLLWLTALFFPFKEYKTQGIILVIFIILSGILYWFWGFRMDTKKHSLIYLYDYSSAPSFFRRNKDSILLMILSAAIGSIFTLIISWLLRKI